MSTQTAASFDAILKDIYRGTIVELLNQETYLIDQLEKTNANDLGSFNGRRLIFAVHSSRNRGRGGITDGGTLSTAGRQGYLDGIVSIKYFNQGIEFTDLVNLQSQNDEGAFGKAMTLEMDGAMTDLRKDISRMTYGTGDGLLATIVGTPNGTSITVDSGQYIAVGDPIDILVKSTGATTNGVVGTTVTAVSYTGTKDTSGQAAATLTIANASAGALSTSYGVYIAGDRNNETDGLRNICSTGRILHSIDSSSNPIWDSNVISASNTTAGEDTYMQLAQKIRKRSGKQIDMFLTTLGIQRRLANTYSSQKRFNDANAVKIDGGYSAIMVAAGNDAVPVVSDVDAPVGSVFAIRKDSFAWAELAKPDWLQPPDGGPILQMKDGSTAGTKVAAWQAWIRWPATLVNVAPLRNGQLTNCNDDVPEARL